MKKIAVFASGTGTNAENLAKVFNSGSRIRVDLLIADRKGAGALDRLEALGVESVYIPRKEWREDPERILNLLKEHEIDIIVLAGFLQIVGKEITDAYPGRILNLHPSLLPAYGGKGFWGHNVHEAVLANGEKKSGATVHIVTADIDRGPIVLQKEVEIEEGETPESLEQKVHQAEYDIYPRAVVKLLSELDREPDTKSVANSVEFEEKSDSEGNPAAEEVAKAKPAVETVAEKEADPGFANEREWAKALNIDFKPAEKPEPVSGQDMERQREPQQMKGQAAPQRSVYVNAVNSSAASEENRPMPSSYLVASILATVLCCAIPGIVAIVFSSMVSSKYYSGDYAGAEKSSQRAQIWIIASIVVGIIWNTVLLPLMFFGN